MLRRKAYEYDEYGNKIRDIFYLFTEAIFTSDVNANPDREFIIAQNGGLVTTIISSQYFYGKNKRLIKMLNAKGQETTYQYDSANRKTIEKDNLGNYPVITYHNSNILVMYTT